jgi:uncharacterized protein (TIGR02145 family)
MDFWTDSRDGKIYKCVTIATQTWMAENLVHETPGGSWCYKNKPSYGEMYGRLYDWNTALAACPNGWHLPSKEEWAILANAVGGESIAGAKLKAATGWDEEGHGTDEYGFAALPGGLYRTSFSNAGYTGYWWTASESYSDLAHYWSLSHLTDRTNWGNFSKSYGFSVRCVKDAEPNIQGT